ncbi:Zn(II)2Cys6 transcription factor [Aspergillus affinis]|uniref:Zn(II)2Cys6 transcription factor n=1 Tax=Aspergillus affinis TaxID=1070780 RepID=UPI0022FE4300|nr:uncharacterized protein KD926_009563 [Aspergillus affinis]KAI9045149.1 hypothetical protein KD926_009563 [Aspergillus affinis]
MPRQKRPHVPKVKGCYECSQRRINCDRTEPQCTKCMSKGIICSGFGIRYRFREEVSTRGRIRRRGDVTDGFKFSVQSQDIQHVSCATSSIAPADLDSYPTLLDTHTGLTDQYPTDALAAIQTTEFFPLMTGLDMVAPRSEYLLAYFSNHIAPQMVVMDDSYNGWRCFILPFAYADEMVMDAVSAVSAFHICEKGGRQRDHRPDRLYAKVIAGLQGRSTFRECDLQTRHSIFLAIIVLLVGVMVNGSSDFPILFYMLQSALEAVGGKNGLGDGELTRFLMRQIRKMRVYAAPLLSQEAGVQTILSSAQKSFDCLYFNSGLHPDHSSTFDLIVGLRQQAYDIYLQRAMLGRRSRRHVERIERFIDTLQSLPDDAPGQHTLVWPSFIAASESSIPEHQLFFKQFLEGQYHLNGFSNILKAIELLERIWTNNNGDTWPALLPESRLFVM